VTPLDAAIRQMLRKARQKLASATRALEAEDWDDASSRAYPAFHAISAVLWKQGLTVQPWANARGLPP
jgi:uncharacterized protein (UPF0332 family)